MPILKNRCSEVHVLPLDDTGRVEACCIIAREKLESGDYEAGLIVLKPWWNFGEWPRHNGLPDFVAAELLLTTGILSGWIASTKQTHGGQKPAEALLSGAVALFEQMGKKSRAAEGRIELACCYFWQGLFDLARTSLQSSFSILTDRKRTCLNSSH